MPILVNDILAQAAKPTAPRPVQAPGPVPGVPGFLQGFNPIVGGINLLDIGLAIVILLVGWLVAALLAGGIGSLLKRTNLDNRLGAWITGRQEGSETLPTEKWISTAVFWVVMIFVLVAFFDKLRLTAVSVPLNTFLTQITGFLPKLGSALILIAVAWGLATVAKLVVTRGLRAFGLDERLNEQAGTTPTSSPLMLSETLANALYWFIFLLFLTPILETLGLQQALEPVKNLLDQILSALPKILKAVVIGGAGWLLATVVRRIVTNLLAATGTDRLGAQFGVSRATSGQSLSGLLGTIVYVLVLIPTAIASLNALEIDAISLPAIGMLNKILSVLPNIFTAGLILVGAYFLGRFISDIVTNILSGIGFNNILYWLGVQSTPTVSRTRTAAPVPPQAVDEDATVLQQAPVPTRSPSEIIGIVVLVGIMLFAIVTATDVLGLTALTGIFYQILEIAGRVLIGLVVFAIGLYFANLAFHLIRSSGGSQAQMLAHAARISIITLVGAMALQQMGIAPDIVNLAFGLLLGAIAVAVALAFGLGSRDIAAQQVKEWLKAFKEKE